MKRIVLLVFFVFDIVVSYVHAQYQVNYLSSSGDTLTFRVVGYGKNFQKANSDAETKVIKTLMFYGVPNTQYSVPMVPKTETSVMKECGYFLNKFFEGNYQNVIVRSVIVRKFGKDENKQKSLTLDVTVNAKALRLELERNGVIKKFGL